MVARSFCQVGRLTGGGIADLPGLSYLMLRDLMLRDWMLLDLMLRYLMTRRACAVLTVRGWGLPATVTVSGIGIQGPPARLNSPP